MDDIRYWIGFNLTPRIGPVRLEALIEYFGDVETAWRADAASLRAANLPQDALERLLYTREHIDLDAELSKVNALGITVINWDSPSYPAMLKNIAYPPPVLYVRGELTSDDARSVAMVGTRHASAYGKEVARRLSRGLAENGLTIVSGLALGIDEVAHEAALEANGRTIAVCGCGLDIVYPERHRDLAERIARSGALISDYPLGVKPEPANFPPRNRIISGISMGTVVVEADIKSGALITINFALEQGRETFAVPGNIYNRTSTGTNALIQRGEAKLVTCAQDIIEELRFDAPLDLGAENGHSCGSMTLVPETPTEQLLWDHISAEPIHIDDLMRETLLSPAEVSGTLSVMEIKGLVKRVDYARFVRSS